MDEEIIEEFNERFATVEEALNYIANSQAKSEFIHKRDIAQHKKQMAEIGRLQESTQRHLDHITKVLRFNIEEYEFQEHKITEAGKILTRKRKK